MAKVKITGHASGSGVLTVTAPNTSSDRTITLPDATGTLLNSDGDGSSLTSLPAHTGNVAFPATQVASADANTLDDYEEGTWTPVIGGSTSESGQTYSVSAGSYVKIGRAVTCQCRVVLSAKGTITGSIRLKGFPFTTSSVEGQGRGAVSLAGQDAWSLTADHHLLASVTPNTTVANIQEVQFQGDATSNTATANVGNTTGLIGTIMYSI